MPDVPDMVTGWLLAVVGVNLTVHAHLCVLRVLSFDSGPTKTEGAEANRKAEAHIVQSITKTETSNINHTNITPTA